ncbi:MAG: putative O-methyltransferase, partial [Modestobacter sp.]|nr:putative O-methyltransferase [Modestobacter sp.]
MDDAVRRIADALYADGVEHDAAEPDRLRRRRNLEPDAAALLGVVLRAMGARSVVEVGTSNGYSTLWLADAVRATGGRVLSVDLDADGQATAAGTLRQAGLDEWVELRCADGGQALRELPDGSQDVVFLDSERSEYEDWWPHPVRVLRPGGLLVIDNVLSHPDEVAAFLTLVDADP